MNSVTWDYTFVQHSYDDAGNLLDTPRKGIKIALDGKTSMILEYRQIETLFNLIQDTYKPRMSLVPNTTRKKGWQEVNK
jgi:hypothetical protein